MRTGLSVRLPTGGRRAPLSIHASMPLGHRSLHAEINERAVRKATLWNPPFEREWIKGDQRGAVARTAMTARVV